MRRRILLVCGIILVICAWLVLRRAPELKKIGSNEINVATRNPPEQRTQPEPSKSLPNKNTARPSEALIAEMIRSGTPERSNEIRQRILADWQQPIEFYGKVVDENSNPVAGAKIQFHWASMLEDDASSNSATESDSEGLFSLHGKQGGSLTVWVSKKGYLSLQGGQKGFSYAVDSEKHSPDPQTPVMFFLRKKGEGVELITSDHGVRPNLVLRVPTNGIPIRVDFFQKQISPSGQLEISQHKPPWRDATEWSFRIAIPDGGLIENNDEFQFEAPEAGYQSVVELHFKKSETNWITHFAKNYYIAFGKARTYGWVNVETELSQQSVFLKYAINPNGSRNLEPIEIKPHHDLPPGVTEVIPKFE